MRIREMLDMRVDKVFQPFQIVFGQTASDVRGLSVRADDQRVFEIVAVVDNVQGFKLVHRNQKTERRNSQPFRFDSDAVFGNDNPFFTEK